MHKKFASGAIEKKWQAAWAKQGLYDVAKRDEQKAKEYVLVEWPYPSGNLHIGHWYAFAVPDIYVRLRRMQGAQVLFPMGFDAFGLPAENAAIKRNVNPRQWTQSNIAHMKTQLASMGNAFTWNKTCSSTDPEYYRWTQWLFTRFFEAGIAYRGRGVVNWCPGCNTVIANEQVLADATCERCGTAVKKRELPQWMIKITDFADALVDDLDALKWPEHIKEAQRQWIGRSQGAEIDFTLSTGDTVPVFTTRPDTLYGATYLVLAPEHKLVAKNQTAITNWGDVSAYVEQATKLAEADRLNLSKEKTGVPLLGITATNPATGATIPVYVADYVLAHYGSGAIMAVPAHDGRDYDFAKKFDLPITPVVRPKKTTAIAQRADKEGVSRANNEPYTGPGTLYNSGEFNGLDSETAQAKIVAKVGGRLRSTYRLRDWSIGRQRYWGVPIPIVYDPAGVAHPVPKEHLPWMLPEDVDCTPTGEAPLTKSAELKERTERVFGAGWRPEVETMDTFVDSSWYFLRYLDNQNNECFSSREAQRAWLPVDVYFGGAEHTTMHLLYSRFWQKALHKLGLTEHAEPYAKRINRGLILGPDGGKMSKSKGNVIDPDEQVKQVGADTVKMYLAFMGPYEGSNYPWDMGGLTGMRRFLERVNGLAEHMTDTTAPKTEQLLHQTIAKVTADVTQYKFNTAISALMILVNAVEKTGLSRADYERFLRLLAPFAPHLTEELWEALGYQTSIHSEAYPTHDPTLATKTEVTIGVQINGKVRGEITIAKDATEAAATAAASTNQTLSRYLEAGTVRKVIYKPGKILNLIVD